MAILPDPTRPPVPIRCPSGHRLATATHHADSGWLVRGKGPWPIFVGPPDPVARPADGSPTDPADPGGGLLMVGVGGPTDRRRLANRWPLTSPLSWSLGGPDRRQVLSCPGCVGNFVLDADRLTAALARWPRQFRLPADTPYRTALPRRAVR